MQFWGDRSGRKPYVLFGAAIDSGPVALGRRRPATRGSRPDARRGIMQAMVSTARWEKSRTTIQAPRGLPRLRMSSSNATARRKGRNGQQCAHPRRPPRPQRPPPRQRIAACQGRQRDHQRGRVDGEKKRGQRQPAQAPPVPATAQVLGPPQQATDDGADRQDDRERPEPAHLGGRVGGRRHEPPHSGAPRQPEDGAHEHQPPTGPEQLGGSAVRDGATEGEHRQQGQEQDGEPGAPRGVEGEGAADERRCDRPGRDREERRGPRPPSASTAAPGRPARSRLPCRTAARPAHRRPGRRRTPTPERPESPARTPAAPPRATAGANRQDAATGALPTEQSADDGAGQQDPLERAEPVEPGPRACELGHQRPERGGPGQPAHRTDEHRRRNAAPGTRVGRCALAGHEPDGVSAAATPSSPTSKLHVSHVRVGAAPRRGATPGAAARRRTGRGARPTPRPTRSAGPPRTRPRPAGAARPAGGRRRRGR